MNIILNGDVVETRAATLADLLTERGLSGRVATAINEAFVPAGSRSETHLNEGDRIEVLAPMQGG